jgi:2-keto-4-pentenoate hydratase/2-oxohepta-3-ene-1,7-dioic acid hydratase in catechol pathway
MGTDWVACKSAPSWSPLGPYLVPAAFVPNPQNLRLVLKLNGETKQDGNTNDMIFNIAAQIEFLSKLTQLLPGDVICTGTPSGNGLHYGRYLRPGDIMECNIEGVGAQRNVCEAENADR